MAYWRLNRKTAATYESCSTAAFMLGRTETIRPLTMETKRASELFDNPNAPVGELYQAMKDCTTVHNKLTRSAAVGECAL